MKILTHFSKYESEFYSQFNAGAFFLLNSPHYEACAHYKQDTILMVSCHVSGLKASINICSSSTGQPGPEMKF